MQPSSSFLTSGITSQPVSSHNQDVHFKHVITLWRFRLSFDVAMIQSAGISVKHHASVPVMCCS
jgi:hypothetical protein